MMSSNNAQGLDAIDSFAPGRSPDRSRAVSTIIGLRQLKNAELAAKVGPEKGAGAWKWTGKAVEWMEKHAR